MNEKDKQNEIEKATYTLMDRDQVKDFYEKTRQQITHEDLLINYRLTWLLAINAFLFVAYGASMTAEAAKLEASKITNTIYTLVAIGLISSSTLFSGILAATRSMHNLVQKWENLVDTKTAECDYVNFRYPQIIGNKRHTLLKMRWGLLPAYILPCVFFLIWLHIWHITYPQQNPTATPTVSYESKHTPIGDMGRFVLLLEENTCKVPLDNIRSDPQVNRH
jgi:hypothetical protein